MKPPLPLLIIVFLPPLAYGQNPTYTGGQTLTIVMTTEHGPETLVFHDLEARVNTALEQLEFTTPVSQAELDEYTDTVELVSNLATTDDPIMIIVPFPDGNINLEDFHTQSESLPGEVHLADQVFLTPVQLEGLYENDTLVLDLEATITHEVESVAGGGVDELQLYAHGVRIYHLTDE